MVVLTSTRAARSNTALRLFAADLIKDMELCELEQELQKRARCVRGRLRGRDRRCCSHAPPFRSSHPRSQTRVARSERDMERLRALESERKLRTTLIQVKEAHARRIVDKWAHLVSSATAESAARAAAIKLRKFKEHLAAQKRLVTSMGEKHTALTQLAGRIALGDTGGGDGGSSLHGQLGAMSFAGSARSLGAADAAPPPVRDKASTTGHGSAGWAAGAPGSASASVDGAGSSVTAAMLADRSERDAARDRRRDKERDAARDEARDRMRDASRDLRRDTERDAERDKERDAKRDRERDAVRDRERDLQVLYGKKATSGAPDYVAMEESGQAEATLAELDGGRTAEQRERDAVERYRRASAVPPSPFPATPRGLHHLDSAGSVSSAASAMVDALAAKHKGEMAEVKRAYEARVRALEAQLRELEEKREQRRERRRRIASADSAADGDDHEAVVVASDEDPLGAGGAADEQPRAAERAPPSPRGIDAATSPFASVMSPAAAVHAAPSSMEVAQSPVEQVPEVDTSGDDRSEAARVLEPAALPPPVDVQGDVDVDSDTPRRAPSPIRASAESPPEEEPRDEVGELPVQVHPSTTPIAAARASPTSRAKARAAAERQRTEKALKRAASMHARDSAAALMRAKADDTRDATPVVLPQRTDAILVRHGTGRPISKRGSKRVMPHTKPQRPARPPPHGKAEADLDALDDSILAHDKLGREGLEGARSAAPAGSVSSSTANAPPLPGEPSIASLTSNLPVRAADGDRSELSGADEAMWPDDSGSSLPQATKRLVSTQAAQRIATAHSRAAAPPFARAAPRSAGAPTVELPAVFLPMPSARLRTARARSMRGQSSLGGFR